MFSYFELDPTTPVTVTLPPSPAAASPNYPATDLAAATLTAAVNHSTTDLTAPIASATTALTTTTATHRTISETFRILSVDDSSMKRMLVKIYSQNWTQISGIPCEVVEVEDGFTGIQACAHAMNRLTPFHLVVMDCLMPEVGGIRNGIEAAYGIRGLFLGDAVACTVTQYLLPEMEDFKVRKEMTSDTKEGAEEATIVEVNVKNAFDKNMERAKVIRNFFRSLPSIPAQSAPVILGFSDVFTGLGKPTYKKPAVPVQAAEPTASPASQTVSVASHAPSNIRTPSLAPVSLLDQSSALTTATAASSEVEDDTSNSQKPTLVFTDIFCFDAVVESLPLRPKEFHEKLTAFNHHRTF